MSNFFTGILIGAGAILPGISSGVFLCCFGLYERIIDSVLHFFKDIKNNLKFIVPIATGTLVGIFLFGNILKIAYSKFHMPTSFAFIGLVLGSLKLVIKQANIKKLNFSHILCILLTFSFSLYLVVLENNLNITSHISSSSYLILSGAIMSAGIVIPAISKTVILMILGLYSTYLSAIASLDFSFLIPIGIGLAIGGIIFLFLINLLFKIAKSYTYFAIIGFIIGSIPIIYPGFTFNLEGFISLALLCLCFIVGLKLSNFNN